MQPIHAAACHFPLLGHVLVHDIADVTHEHDPLPLHIVADPLRVRVEDHVRQVGLAVRLTFRIPPLVRLRVRDDDHAERPGRSGRKRFLPGKAPSRQQEHQHGRPK